MDILNVLKNVIAIIGIIAAGAFIIVFLADLLISIIDGKNGIFFKRGNASEPSNEPQPTREKVLEIEEPKNEVKLIGKPKENNGLTKIDFDKADEEERMLREKLQLNVFADEDEINNNLKKASEEEELRAKIRELEERNQKLESSLQAKPVVKQEINADKLEVSEDDSDEMLDYFNEYKDIIDAITADATSEDEKEEPVTKLPSIDDILGSYDESEEIASNLVNDKVEEQEVVEEPAVEETKAEVVEEPAVEETQEVVNEEAIPEESEEDKKLIAQIEELRRQLEDEKAKMEQMRMDAMYKTAMLEGEKERLEAELIIAKEQTVIAKDSNPVMLSKEECESRLEMLKERLKFNEKQVRANRKEFKPLERIKKTLESDKQKLRRKEALVAKQKVILYGVNNYVDIDEDKAKKLSEDLDILDGLRLSVQHCEEVMQANRDRYPILEQTNNILLNTNKQILDDIKECEKTLEQIAKKANND